jgi:protein-S-isoprenylcysteine O-methyltransferase Ste14
MKNFIESFLRIALLLLIWIVWWWVFKASISNVINLSVIVGGVLLTFPLVWLGRKILDRGQTIGHAVRTTTFVHLGMGFTFGVPIVRAVSTHHDWTGWVLPIPSVIGLVLVLITGAAFLLTVINLALKGSGAPFYIALSRELAVDWMYAWTRNPMALAALALFLSLGIWFQSALFLFWVLIVLAPAYVFFAKVFEERELEIRFGASYQEYKSRTPMFFPRKPGR